MEGKRGGVQTGAGKVTQERVKDPKAGGGRRVALAVYIYPRMEKGKEGYWIIYMMPGCLLAIVMKVVIIPLVIY